MPRPSTGTRSVRPPRRAETIDSSWSSRRDRKLATRKRISTEPLLFSPVRANLLRETAPEGYHGPPQESRSVRSTPAHKTGDLAELVCSNSLRSDDPFHAAGMLKREMEA